MSIFYPNERYRRITDISPQQLKTSGFEGIILDVDNTLTTHDNPKPGEGVMDWLAAASNAGLKLIILSNNTPERVKPFAEMLGLEFEANGKKPLTSGYLRAVKSMGITKDKALAIGDQIFTDILGARLSGIYSILTDPIEPEHTAFFKFKRKAEKPILAMFERRNRK